VCVQQAFGNTALRLVGSEKLACSAEPILAAGIPPQVIDVVRDLRDVVASMIAFGERAGPWGFGRNPGQSESEWLTHLIEVSMTGSMLRSKLAALRRCSCGTRTLLQICAKLRGHSDRY
jgi:hypothetical protein